MRKVASLIFAFMLICQASFAFDGLGSGYVQASGGDNTYVPATALIHSGGQSSAGTASIIIGIYKDSDDSLVCESEIFSMADEVVSGSIDGADALELSTDYTLVVKHGSGHNIYSSATEDGGTRVISQSWATDLPDTLASGSFNSLDSPLIQIKNADGDVILGPTDISGGSKQNFSTIGYWYNNSKRYQVIEQ